MLRKIGIGVLGVLALLVAIALLGPRVDIDTEVEAITVPADVARYVADREAAFDDIVPGTAAEIVWAHADQRRTPLAIIYLPGFSATHPETAPLAEELATELGANLFNARLTGHGRTGEALAEATVNDWLADTREALEIGRQLGDEIIVVGVSTGGAAAAWLATQPDVDDVAAFVLMSPNFGVADSTAEIMLWPWGEQMIRAVLGPERSWEAENELHDLYWTNQYPSTALLTMMGMVEVARSADLENVTTPVLMITAPDDTIISVAAAADAFERFGSPIKEAVSLENSQDPAHHVLAGDILAPNDTPRVREIILSFLAPLLS